MFAPFNPTQRIIGKVTFAVRLEIPTPHACNIREMVAEYQTHRILRYEVWDRHIEDDRKTFTILQLNCSGSMKRMIKENKKERWHSSLKARSDLGVCLVLLRKPNEPLTKGKWYPVRKGNQMNTQFIHCLDKRYLPSDNFKFNYWNQVFPVSKTLVTFTNIFIALIHVVGDEKKRKRKLNRAWGTYTPTQSVTAYTAR